MSATVRLTAAFPEARRMAEFIERDFGEDGVAVSLLERADTWIVEALFPEDDTDQALRRVSDCLGSDGFDAPMQAETVDDIDWMAVSLSALHPVSVGRFFVHGSHDRSRLPAGRITVEIDAAQAFGTGHHATTAGCLCAIDRELKKSRPANALDIGTGSGVLAIALARAIRVPVLATDIDPLAVMIAAENAKINGVASRVRTIVAAGIRHRDILARAPFDLVAANILAAPLQRLAPDIAAIIAPGGKLILSGLLVGQRERVVAAYCRHGIFLERARQFEDWCVLTLFRPRRSLSPQPGKY